MAKTMILALGGTFHGTGGDGVTDDFLSHFPDELYDKRFVAYPADFGKAMSFAESRAAGIQAMRDAVDALPGSTPIVLAGYSQGAVIQGDFARWVVDMGAVTNVVACALIADGLRPQGVGLVPPGESLGLAEGYGIIGQRLVPADRFPTYWVSAWGDPISALPEGNPLRTLGDLVQWMNLSSPTAEYLWVQHMIDTVKSGRLQDWWAPWKWAGWNGALAFLRGYLVDGRHTNDYILHDYTRTIANAVRSHLEG